MPKDKRKVPKKTVKPTLRIFCEGAKTEPLYLNAFIDSLPPSRFGIAKVEKTDKNTPVQLVETAIKHKEVNENNDIYWVVYDRESEQKYTHSLHLESRQKAESRKQKAESRKQKAESRKQKAESRKQKAIILILLSLMYVLNSGYCYILNQQQLHIKTVMTY